MDPNELDRRVDSAEFLAHDVLPTVMANTIMSRLRELASFHRRHPGLLDFKGQPSYAAEAFAIIAELHLIRESLAGASAQAHSRKARLP